MFRGIDTHIHFFPPSGIPHPPTTAADATANYFGSARAPRFSSPDQLAAFYEQINLFGVIIGWDVQTARGSAPTSNDAISAFVQKHSKQFIGFGGLDPWKGKAAIQEAEHCANDLGLRGVKFHPSSQAFYPNEHRFYPLWQKCSDLGLILLIHTGTTGDGAGQPGGGGVKLGYSRPIPYVDDVAADFPDLKIIMAHPAFPWQDEQLAMLVHKPNVYMDLSGWSPKHFSANLIQYANTRAQDKMLFGSDFPAINPERWLSDFAAAPFRDEVRPKILMENAKKLLNLDI